MKERPIRFSAPMVHAILSGEKTMTRRVIKPQPYIDKMNNFCWNGYNFGQDFDGPKIQAIASPIPCSKTKRVLCPYGNRGDRLWVREAFRFAASLDRYSPKNVGIKCLDAGYKTPWAPTQYEADGARKGSWAGFDTPPVITTPGKLRPSMFMPRWASRITLEITGVRVERLNDISDSDCWAEGIDECDGLLDDLKVIDIANRMGRCIDDAAPFFAALWESINGNGSWLANPFVWVVEFKRVF